MIQQPSIGRTVHFVGQGGAHWPAVITRVWSSTLLNLHILPDMNPAFCRASVSLDEHRAKESTWHWPEAQPALGHHEEPKGKPHA